jgi:hypothetical protein
VPFVAELPNALRPSAFRRMMRFKEMVWHMVRNACRLLVQPGLTQSGTRSGFSLMAVEGMIKWMIFEIMESAADSMKIVISGK